MASPANRRFSKPIVTRDGLTLATTNDALTFLKALPADQVTPAIYYAHFLLEEARDKGKPSKVERARAELQSVLGKLGWL